MSNPVSPLRPAGLRPASSGPSSSGPPSSGPASSGPASPGWPGAQIRIGDAERTEVADRLARHFSDGRLDETEFGERLDRAMRAKTMADLSVLLADLPGEPALAQDGGRRDQRKIARTELERERLALKAELRAQRRATRRRRWRSLRMLVLLIALVVGAVAIAHWLVNSVAVWIIIGVIAFLWLRRNTARGHGGRQRAPDDLRQDR